MAQRGHFRATDTPRDITAGLDEGQYVGQVRGLRGDSNLAGVIYATATAAPAVTDDYFQAGPEEAFVFCVGAGVDPTWVAVDPEFDALLPGVEVVVAVARTGA